MNSMTSHIAKACLLLLAGCASSPAQLPPQEALGESKATAVEVCKPSGERAYLARLVCADGTRPTFVRQGSFGMRTAHFEDLPKEQQDELFKTMLSGRALKPGEKDYHVIDGYEVTCGQVKRIVYMDMYHCEASPPDKAPAGFRMNGAL
jgi:hypothetical protein